MKTPLMLIAVVITAGLMLASPTTIADCAIKFDVSKGGQAMQSQVIKVKGDKVLIDDVGGDARTDVLFNSKEMVMSIINHQQRSYLIMDRDRVTELATQANNMMSAVEKQMAAQLAGMPPEQREQMRAMMSKMGMGGMTETSKKPAPRSFVKAGTKKVYGAPCQQYRVNQGSNKVGEVCVATPADLKISRADYQNLLALQQFGETMANQAGSMAGRFGIDVPSFSGKAFEGIPVEMIDHTNGGSTMIVSAVNHDTLSATEFEIPAGYQAQTLPTIPGATH